MTDANRDHDNCYWRTGHKVGRTIYARCGGSSRDDDLLIGLMDTSELAKAVVDAHNIVLGSLPFREDER